jgi:hypothetical protein
LKTIEERFSKYLKDIIWPTQNQKEKEFWNVSGILKEKSNQHLKFDVRPMFNMLNGQLGKKGTTLSKTDKIVFETNKDWIIIDIVELHEYIKKKSSKIIQFEDLLKKLEWNIYISKV